jgi:hypothetical protein
MKLCVLEADGRAPWIGNQPIGRSLPRQDNTERKLQIIYSLFSSEIRTTIPMFERVKTFLALDRVAFVSGTARTVDDIIEIHLKNTFLCSHRSY